MGHSLQVISQIPKSERVARELVPLLDNPQQLNTAWDTACLLAGGEPTASLVRTVVATMREEPAPLERLVSHVSREEKMLEEHNRLAAEENDRIFKLIEALQNLESMPCSPDAYIALLPNYMESMVEEPLDAAHRWLTRFVYLWRTRHESKPALKGT